MFKIAWRVGYWVGEPEFVRLNAPVFVIAGLVPAIFFCGHQKGWPGQVFRPGTYLTGVRGDG